MNKAAFAAKAIGAVTREQKRTIEVDIARPLREQHCRRYRERRRHHAANHDSETPAFRFGDERQRLSESAALVELDVDGIIFAGEPSKRRAIMHALIGADR